MDQGWVRVIDPGRINPYSGPDFRCALMEFSKDGIRRGDVEIHLRESDWTAHGHHRNPDYGNVILHVVRTRVPEYVNRPDIPVIVLTDLSRRQRLPCEGLSTELGQAGIMEILENLARIRWTAAMKVMSSANAAEKVFRLVRIADFYRSDEDRIQFHRELMHLVSRSVGVNDILNYWQIRLPQFKSAANSQFWRDRLGIRMSLISVLSYWLVHDRIGEIAGTMSDWRPLLFLIRDRGLPVPGQGFLQEIRGNVVIPYIQQFESRDLFDTWVRLPVRTYARTRYFMKTWGVKTAVTFGLQQGILQLENDVCLNRICEHCPLMINSPKDWMKY